MSDGVKWRPKGPGEREVVGQLWTLSLFRYIATKSKAGELFPANSMKTKDNLPREISGASKSNGPARVESKVHVYENWHRPREMIVPELPIELWGQKERLTG